MKIRSMLAVCVVGVLLGSSAGPVSAHVLHQRATQPPPQGARGEQAPKPADQISPADIQSMFDAMAMTEAERFIPVSQEQYPTFVVKLKRLQTARTQQNRVHNKVLNELRAMVNPQPGRTLADDAAIEAKLQELTKVEVDGRAAVAKALDDLDQLLSVRQRARFRLLEENVERRKLDFLAKVRK